MNTEELIKKTEDELALTNEQTEDILKLAAVGMGPRDIAAALELDPRKTNIFIALASVPGSSIAQAINIGTANGVATPQIKLQEAAASGNIEAIRELNRVQVHNRFKELLNNMDDDEFTI